MVKKSLTEALISYMEEVEIPLSELARRMGVNYGTLRKIVSGESEPKTAMVIKSIARFLDSVGYEREAYELMGMNSVKKFRIEHELSQRDAANLLGVHQATFSKYESGRHHVPDILLEKIRWIDSGKEPTWRKFYD